MHWLTWQQFVGFLSTWQGAAATALGVLAAIYYGPKKMLETWDWYMDRFFDHKVKDALSENVTPEALTVHGPRRWAIPMSVSDIAKKVGMSQRRVTGCLRRLKKKGKVIKFDDKWGTVI